MDRRRLCRTLVRTLATSFLLLGFKPSDLRAAESVGPRLGKYLIYSYGAVAARPLFLGHFELMDGGKYRVSRTSSGGYFGEGNYRFDAANSTVIWTSGPYATSEWGGAFSVVEGGKRHRIALRARTIATNSAP